MMSGAFLAAGWTAWKRAPDLAPRAKRLAEPLADLTGLPITGSELVRINAGVQLGAGALFALGVQQRLMALVLAGTLIPATLVDDPERASRRDLVLERMALAGGLLFAALDTGGRPSVFWMGRRKAGEIADSIGATTQAVGRTVSDVLH